jgi:hypothetical protein
MKHNDTSQMISALIERIGELHELDLPQRALDHLEEATYELQEAIKMLDKDEGTTH